MSDDLLRSSSKAQLLGSVRPSAFTGFTAAARQIVRMQPRDEPRRPAARRKDALGQMKRPARFLSLILSKATHRQLTIPNPLL